MGTILVLRALALALHDNAARHVRDPHRAVGLVDVLTTSTRRAIGVDAQILIVDLDLDLVVNDRVNPDRGKARVAAIVRIEWRNAHKAMNAALRFEPAISIGAVDANRRRFDPGLLAAAFLEPFDLVSVGIGPAHIHAQQHLCPILGLGSARPGMDFEIAVVAVGFARQQAFEFAPRRLGAQFFERGLGLGDDRRVTLALAQFDQFERFVDLALDTSITADRLVEPRALAQQLLRVSGVFPQPGVFDFAVQFGETPVCRIPVKDASSAGSATF